MRSRALTLLLLGAICLSSCSSGGDSRGDTGSTRAELSASMATSDLHVGAPQRVSFGLVLPDNRLVSFGSVNVTFSFVGTAQQPVQPQPGPAMRATYVPVPETPDRGGEPTATRPSEARGVYLVENVSFDRAGFWQLDATATVQGLGVRRARTTFPVAEHAAYPAPGDPAPETENLTLRSHDDAPLAAVDSRAANSGHVPDPELHRWTIADAIAQGRPALVVFSTPVYCVSQFCGPVTDVVADLASRYSDRAIFIHIEIWRDFQNQTINQAAADWLYRNGDLTEPWVFLIGADGTILDRWATLFREDDLAAALRALPKMKA